MMITDAHTYAGLRDCDRQVLRCLREVVGEFRDDLAVILAGDAALLGELLQASPSLAARFPVIIDFPGYTAGQLAAIFTVLAREAGFTVDPDAARQAADILNVQARASESSGNARLAVRLLDQAIARQARRIAAAAGRLADGELCVLQAGDIPDLPVTGPASPADDRPGQYL